MTNVANEEGVIISKFGDKISKELKVFYNPDMKINRDISLLFINSYFNKEIKYCDPMAATGIREIRFLKTIPNKFEKIVCGDISSEAIKDIENNFKNNKIESSKIELYNSNAVNTMMTDYFDFIEIDPFGSPIPFLDIACQRVKHNGVISVTATDTAPLCGTYPKTCLRKYGIKIVKTLWYYELGLRNLIAYTKRQAAKYDKNVTPILCFSNNHFYKIFFKVEESKTKAYTEIKNLKWINWDKKTQDIIIEEFETKTSIGKTYVGILNDKALITDMISNINIVLENKIVLDLLEKLNLELDTLGYYNPHKLQKEFKLDSKIKYKQLFEELEKLNIKYSKVHNDKYGIKIESNHEPLLNILKKYS